MDAIQNIAKKYNLFIVEDAAQAIDSYYLPREINNSNDNNIFVSSAISLGEGKPLGSIGTFGTFSFHETKNITSGEGSLLAINDERFFSEPRSFERKELIVLRFSEVKWINIIGLISVPLIFLRI